MNNKIPNLINVDWLVKYQNEADLLILDASWYMPAEARNPDAEFDIEHIAGAQRFDFDARVKDQNSELPHMLPTPDDFQLIARELGINGMTKLVIYDGSGIFASPRAWWMFKVMGHENVAVLNGGLPAWKSAGNPVESGSAVDQPAGEFVAELNKARMSDAQGIQNLLSSDVAQVVDARGAARFRGEQAEPRAGLRSGHIPGARNLPFDQLLMDGRFRDVEQIRTCYLNAGLTGEKPIVASCGSGVTASILALGAEVAGFDPVAVYDGSWAEWGQENRPDLVVVTGE
ncbi:MAG: 3-mercaptopyruvate sulfurtransferase [Rhodobacteraceae bacterium]|nr:3-mercaptopyruvate sulfurtransferase [Paracoccaceae bacterium]